MSTYVNTLIATGLQIEQLAEPQPTGAFAARHTHFRDVPGILVVRCTKRLEDPTS